MMENDWNVHTSCYYPIEENLLLMTAWTSITRVNKDDVDKSFGQVEVDDLISNEQFNKHVLNLSTTIGQWSVHPDENEAGRSPMETYQRRTPTNNKASVGKQGLNQVGAPESTLGRSRRTRNAPNRFEN